MTSTTLDSVATPAPSRAQAGLARFASYAGSAVEERRAVRAWRRQERAMWAAHGSELADLHALSRRG